jgi:hypothetical protein
MSIVNSIALKNKIIEINKTSRIKYLSILLKFWIVGLVIIVIKNVPDKTAIREVVVIESDGFDVLDINFKCKNFLKC